MERNMVRNMTRPMTRSFYGTTSNIIPSTLLPYVYAWWDARQRGNTSYSLTNMVVGRLATTDGWTLSSASHSAANNIYSFTGNVSSTAMASTYSTLVNISTNKVIYTSGKLKITGSGVTSILIRLRGSTSGVTGQQTFKSISSPAEGTWIPFTGSAACQATMTGNVAIAVVINAPETNGIKVEIDGIYGFVSFDLSANIGIGNEPAAIEMDAIISAGGVTYWEGAQSVLCNPEKKFYWYDYSAHGRYIKLNNFGYTGTTSNWISNPMAIKFDGIDDNVRYVNASINAANTSFTLMCAFNIPDTTGNKLNCMTSDEALSAALNLYASGSTLTAECSDSAAGSANVTTTIQATKWYIAFAVYNQTDKKVRLYLNGALIGISSALTNGLRAITRIKAGINTSESSYSSQSIGTIAAFSRALSISEVQQLFSANKGNYGI